MEIIHDHFTDLLVQVYGAGILKYDESFVKNSIRKLIKDPALTSVSAYLESSLNNNEDAAIFEDLIQINYSEFFRNSLTFAVIEHIILPSIIMNNLKGRKQTIRIWSVACAGGQEMYSLAILVEELRSVINAEFKLMLFATDRNQASINQAIKGIFHEQALSKVTLDRTNKWFMKNDKTYAVNQRLKENINFSVFDILDERWSSPPEGIFGNYDLIFCANILFYYKEAYRKIIIEKLSACLSPGGFLVTGEAERDLIKNYNFVELFPQSAIFKKKSVL